MEKNFYLFTFKLLNLMLVLTKFTKTFPVKKSNEFHHLKNFSHPIPNCTIKEYINQLNY